MEMIKGTKAQKNTWDLLVSVDSYKMRTYKVLVLMELSKGNYSS